MSIYLILALVWLVCDIVVLVGLGILGILMFDSELSDHYSRGWRVAMVAFGPLSLIYFLFVKVPILNIPGLLIREVLLKK